MTHGHGQEPTPVPTAGLTLAIDCSTSVLALALVRQVRLSPGGLAYRTLASSAEDVGRQHAALLTVHLAELFKRAGAQRSGVGRIHVGIGPGSYTGVRVAVAAAKGLARAWGVEVLGVYSLLAQAGDSLPVGGKVVITRDARRGNVYAQPCERLEAGPEYATERGRTSAQRDAVEPPRIVALAPPEKVPADAVMERFAGLRIVQASTPDAAVLAVSSDTRAPEPLYL